ncbi:hypothetical protein NQ318_013462 [Aromia moschata]|uniref:Uncharacterized protein n=1 Tax=Aromia moschata TaxID=1265417 RepID=A0AAV8YEC9_9CUCU|nr:hypothetical protein NQ318_013462 [Aromia moschata]
MNQALKKSCRAQLTKLVNQANELLSAESFDVREAAVLVSRLKSTNDSLNKINKEVASEIPVEQIESECEKIIEYEDKAVAAIAGLEYEAARVGGSGARVVSVADEVASVTSATGAAQDRLRPEGPSTQCKRALKKSPARLCKKVSVTLKSEYSDELITINAVEVPEICFDSLCTPSLEDPAIYNFSIKFSLADSPNFNTKTVPGISILIGADYYWKIVTNNTQKITESLMGIETKFGWTIHGVGGGHPNEYAFAVSVNVANILHVQCEVKDNDFDLKNFWTLESIGIDNVKVTESLQTDKFMTSNVTFDNNRYCVSLPWKDQCVGVDSNFNGALNRLKSLTRRLANTGKFEEYDNAIREYIDNDCAELSPRVPDSNKTYFMPHRAVYRDDKDTSKIRVVFDASAHAPGLPSLNDVLLPKKSILTDRIIWNAHILTKHGGFFFFCTFD